MPTPGIPPNMPAPNKCTAMDGLARLSATTACIPPTRRPGKKSAPQSGKKSQTRVPWTTVGLDTGITDFAQDTWTAVPWDVADVDNYKMWNSANATRLTVPRRVGRVRVQAMVRFTGVGTNGQFGARIYMNGAAIPNSTPTGQMYSTATSDVAIPISTPVIDVSQGDYFEIFVTQPDVAGELDAAAIQMFHMEIVEATNPAQDAMVDNFRGCLAYNSVDQGIVDAVDTVLTFDSEVYDTDAIHSTSSNTGRFTVPTGVTRVRLIGNVSMDSDDIVRIAYWFKNGAEVTGGGFVRNRMPTAGLWSTNVVTPPLVVVAGDYFELHIHQFSGVTLNTQSADETWGAMEIVASVDGAAVDDSAGGQAIANLTETAITFDNEQYDTDAIHSTVANTTRVTVPAGVGWVRLYGNGYFSSDNTIAGRLVFIDKNGTTDVPGGYSSNEQLTLPAYNLMTPPIKVVEGDYFELKMFHGAGIGVTTNSGTVANTYLAMEIIR